jgi:hypothetical protein
MDVEEKPFRRVPHFREVLDLVVRRVIPEVLVVEEAVDAAVKVVAVDTRVVQEHGHHNLMEEVEDHTTEAQIKQTQLVINLVEDMSPSPKFSIY